MSELWMHFFLELLPAAFLYLGVVPLTVFFGSLGIMQHRAIFMSFWVRHFLCGFRWYRRWHGGRWELWWIEVCGSYLWLDIDRDKADDWRQPCSAGPRLEREDWPAKPA